MGVGTVTELATFIGSSRQNVRKMLAVLDDKGYVTLTKNTQDKRNLSVELTQQAFNFFERFEATGDLFLAQLFESISPEQLTHSRAAFETFFENIERMAGHND